MEVAVAGDGEADVVLAYETQVPPRPQTWLGVQVRDLIRRPVLLVVLTIALVGYPPTVSDVGNGVQAASVTPADLGAVLLVGSVAVRVLAALDLDILRSRILLCPVLIVAVALLTTAWSTDPMLSLIGVVRYAELFCLVPLAVLLSIRDQVDVVLVLMALVALGAVEGIIGIYQSVTGTGAGIDGKTIRAIGTFGVTNQIAMATVVSLALTVLLAVALRGQPRIRPWATVGCGVLAVALLLSLSRGALLSSVAGAAVILLSAGLRRAVGMFVLLVALAVLVVTLMGGASGPVAARFDTIGSTTSQPDRSVQDRYDLWKTALSIWRSAPVTGVGIKQFPAFRDTHAPLGLSSGSDEVGVSTYTRVSLLSPHNEYLLLLSEQGVLGLGAYLLLLLVLAARQISQLRSRRHGGINNLLCLVAFATLVRFAVDNFYGDIAGSTAVLFSVLLGVQMRSAVADRVPLRSREPMTLRRIGSGLVSGFGTRGALATVGAASVDAAADSADDKPRRASTTTPAPVRPSLVYPVMTEERPSPWPILLVAITALLLLFIIGLRLVNQDSSPQSHGTGSQTAEGSGVGVATTISLRPMGMEKVSQSMTFDHEVSSVRFTVPTLPPSSAQSSLRPRMSNIRVLGTPPTAPGSSPTLRPGQTLKVDLTSPTDRVTVIYEVHGAVSRRPVAGHRSTALVSPLLTPVGKVTSTVSMKGSTVLELTCTRTGATEQPCGALSPRGWTITLGPTAQRLVVLAHLKR